MNQTTTGKDSPDNAKGDPSKTAASRLQPSSMAEVTSSWFPGFLFPRLVASTYSLPVGDPFAELVFLE